MPKSTQNWWNAPRIDEGRHCCLRSSSSLGLFTAGPSHWTQPTSHLYSFHFLLALQHHGAHAFRPALKSLGSDFPPWSNAFPKIYVDVHVCPYGEFPPSVCTLCCWVGWKALKHPDPKGSLRTKSNQQWDFIEKPWRSSCVYTKIIPNYAELPYQKPETWSFLEFHKPVYPLIFSRNCLLIGSQDV